MEYRIANSNDIVSLATMRYDFKTEGKVEDIENKQDFIHFCSDFFKEGIENNSWTHWVAIDKGDIVSHISIKHIEKIPKPNRFYDVYGYVTNVYTKIDYRNQGIGSELMKHVIQWAKDIDLEILIVWPSKKAIKFYENQGFSLQNEVMELELRVDLD